MTHIRDDIVFPHFCSLTPDDLDCDLHIHTSATDGLASVAEVITCAEDNNLTRIAFTEHVRSDSDWFTSFAREVRRLGQESAVSVLVGAEARIADSNGELDISDTIRQECDFVLGSVHRFPGSTVSHIPFSEIPASEFAQREFELALNFIRQGSGDVLAHPGGISYRFGYGFPDEMIRQLMREASAMGVAIELNSAYPPDMRAVTNLAKEENPMVSIGSDVHCLEDLGRCGRVLKEIIWKS